MSKGFLTRLSIGQRIISLAAVAVIAVLVLGATSLVGDRILSSFMEHEEHATELDRLAADVETGALQMRRREKDFLLRRDPKYAEKYEADAAKVLQGIEALAAHPLAEPLMANVEALLALLPQHRDHFRRVVELNTQMGLSEKEGLKGTLRKAVHAVEEELKEANLDPLTVKMLMMRRHEKDYMLRGAAKYIDRIDKRRAEFDALLAAAYLPPADKAAITKLLDAYVAGFKAWAEADQVARAETAQLSEVYAQVQPHLEAIFGAAETELTAVKAEIVALRQTSLTITAGLSLAVLLLAIVAGLVIGRSIRRPLRDMTTAMQALAEGQTDIEIPVSRAQDELAEMGGAVGVFRDNAIERQRLEADRAAEREEKERRAAAVDDLVQRFETDATKVLEDLASLSEQLIGSASEASDTAQTSSTLSTSVAKGANEASENIGTVSAAAEQLTASISEISRKVTEASDIAAKAVTETHATGSTMRGMADAAMKIGDVVTLIQDIAEQTNLLALNATIEAARAGEAGKGFAVVASEVKSLATQTAKATEEISQQIATIQSTSNEAVAANESVGEIIGQVSEVATAIASAVEEQNAATREIAGNVEVVAQSTAEVTENIGQVQTATEQTTGTAKEVDTAAHRLAEHSAGMREKITAFIGGVRAA